MDERHNAEYTVDQTIIYISFLVVSMSCIKQRTAHKAG